MSPPRWYQSCASRKKLNRDLWITRARPLSRSVPKKMVAPEDSLEGGDQTAILLPAVVQAERGKHLRGALEPDKWGRVFDRQCCQEYWDDAVLPEWNPVIGMTGDLKNEVAVPPFVEELVRRQPPHRQPTQNERSRAEAQVLISFYSVASDQLVVTTERLN